MINEKNIDSEALEEDEMEKVTGGYKSDTYDIYDLIRESWTTGACIICGAQFPQTSAGRIELEMHCNGKHYSKEDTMLTNIKLVDK